MCLIFTAAKSTVSLVVIMESVLHDRPVIGLWRPYVSRRAQFTPGPLVIGAAAPTVTVRFLTERIRHGVSPKDTTAQTNQDQFALETLVLK